MKINAPPTANAKNLVAKKTRKVKLNAHVAK